jgi:hypothetical protein
LTLKPRASNEQEHDENDQTLFGGRENKNSEQPFHLLA